MTPRQLIGMAAVAAGLVVPAMARGAEQEPAPQMASVAQAAVIGCAQAHALAERTIDAANRRLESARQANSPAAMRAAIDDLQSALRQIRTDIAPCAGLEPLTPDPHAGHVMPQPAQAPGPPAVPDPHAGHVMPAAPPAPASTRAGPATLATPAASGRPAASTPAATDPHAGHVVPAPAQSPAAAETPAAQPRTTPENPAARLADLTCQPPVDPNTAPRATYMGKAYYFCTAAERDLFLKAPAKYLQAR